MEFKIKSILILVLFSFIIIPFSSATEGYARIDYASPNPCTVPPNAEQCSSTISWASSAPVQLWLSVDGGSESFVACTESGTDTKEIDSIKAGRNYVFKLYSATSCNKEDKGELRDQILVRGQLAVPTIGYMNTAPNPCTIYHADEESCSSTISWETETSLHYGLITVSTNGGDEKRFSCFSGNGDSGSSVADFIKPGKNYVFRLYSVSKCDPSIGPSGDPIDQVLVTGYGSKTDQVDSLTAAPNPCSAPPEVGICQSRISFETKEKTGQVWMTNFEGDKFLFSCGRSGKKVARNIQPDKGDYTFELYSAESCQKQDKDDLLDSVKVSGNRKGDTSGLVTASSEEVPVLGFMGSTRISWQTNARTSQLWMENNGDEKYLSCLRAGKLTAYWILPNEEYEFSLYAADSCDAQDRQELYDSLTVRGVPISNCGNGVCDGGEDCTTCPTDCGPCPEICGNGVCDSAETCSTCPADCGTCPEPPTDKPNIIFIMFDDLGYGDLGSYGSETILTPRMDELRGNGMKLTQYRTMNPVCSPTRASILSGMYPQKFNLKFICDNHDPLGGIPSRFTTLPEMLKAQGYYSAHIGKYHLSMEREEYTPMGIGFDEVVMTAEWPNRYDPKMVLNQSEIVPNEGYATDVFTNYSLRFIENNKDGPFFLNLWYFVPHLPVNQPPLNTKGMYPNDAIGNYSAMVTNADIQIGRIMDKLDELGLTNNTIIIVTSDNGGASETHIKNGELRGFKPDLFDGGIRVPFIISWPGKIQAGSTSESFMTSMDIYPTLAEFIGADVSDYNLDGKSLATSLLTQSYEPNTRDIFIEYRGSVNPTWINDYFDSYAILRDNWKLTFQHLGRRTLMLFDLENDEDESDDLASRNQALVNELHDAYLDWRLDEMQLDYIISSVRGQTTLNNQFDSNGGITYWNDVSFDKTTLQQSFNPVTHDPNLKLAKLDNITFSSPGGIVHLGPNPSFNTGNADFSLTAWINPSQVSQEEVIARKPSCWDLRILPDKKIRLVVRDVDNNAAIYKSTSPISLNEWHNVVFTIHGFQDDNNTVTLYMDGELQAQDALITETNSIDAQLEIGSDNIITFSNPFIGQIKDMRFYLEGLNPDEVKRLYDQGI